MSIRQQGIGRGLRIVGLPFMAVMVAVLLLAWGHANQDIARAQGPGMSLNAPATVFLDQTFVVTIMADPAPDIEFAAFSSEVIFPEGVKWQQRPCAEEVVVGRVDGGPIALCQSFTPILTGGAGTAVLSEFALPATALDVVAGSTTPLVELEFVCNTVGSYKLTLTATPDSSDGALFGGTDGAEMPVKTTQQDRDGDTVPNDVADTVTIECTDAPPPTAVPPTAVPPTAVPPTAVPPTDTPPGATSTVGAGTVAPPVTGAGAGDGGVSVGLWVLIGALLAAAVAAVALFGWRQARAR